MSSVLKYPFGPFPICDVPWVDGGSEVRLVAAQHAEDNAPTIWIEQPDAIAAALLAARFYLIGTGEKIPDRAERRGFDFVGSAVCARGALIWHVYRGDLLPIGEATVHS